MWGKVVSSINLKEVNSFTIKNFKKRIMVVTPNYLPLLGDRILVKGKVVTNCKHRNSTLLVIKEEKKKMRKPQKPKNIGDKLRNKN